MEEKTCKGEMEATNPDGGGGDEIIPNAEVLMVYSLQQKLSPEQCQCRMLVRPQNGVDPWTLVNLGSLAV